MAARWLFFRLLILFSLLSTWSLPVWAYTPPALLGAVNDSASMLSQQERDLLEKYLREHQKVHGNQIVVFTVPGLGRETIEDIAYGAFNGWKLGQQGKDNGVLLVIAPVERKTRIETGKGVGDRITDLQSKQILSERVGPKLKGGKNYEGILAGVTSIASLLTGGPLVPVGEAPTPSQASSKNEEVEPTSIFIDQTGTFPASERTRFLNAYEARKKENKAAFAVVMIQGSPQETYSSICGYNISSFTTAIPSTKGIVTIARDGRILCSYTNPRMKGPGGKNLSSDLTKLPQTLTKLSGEARDQALITGLISAMDHYDIEMPGFFTDPYGDLEAWVYVVIILLILVIIIIIGVKFSGDSDDSSGGGSSYSSNSRSSYSSSSSSRGYSGGYSGGGGSSGGGGASDGYLLCGRTRGIHRCVPNTIVPE